MSEDERTEEHQRIVRWLAWDDSRSSGQLSLSSKAPSLNVMQSAGLPMEGRRLLNRGRQQQAVSRECSGRSGLLIRQTNGGHPSCVLKTYKGVAEEVELGCYELCMCTKGRQCEITVTQGTCEFGHSCTEL